MKLLFLCLSFFTVIGNAAAELSTEISLDQLFAMQTLLRVRLDGEKVCEAELGAISPLAVSAMPQLLEAEVQTKIEKMKAQGELVSYLRDETRQKLCAQKCRCDLYAIALGNKQATRRSRPEAFVKCARSNEKWICKNRLFRTLVAETKKATE